MTQRKFECLSCHHRFEADDQQMVRCPKCQSDNVDLAHFHLPRRWWLWALAVAAAIGLAVALFSVDWKSSAPAAAAVTEETEDEDPDTTTTVIETVDIDIPITQPPMVEMKGKPKFEHDGYAFTVTVKNAPATPYKVAVLDPYDNTKVIKTSDDGRFTDVPPSPDHGTYDLAIIDADKGVLLSAPLRKVGFVELEQVAKLTVAELQQLIDSGNTSEGAGENKQLSPNLKLRYTGDVADGEGPQTLSEMSLMISTGEYEQVTVESVDYDHLNRVASITLRVQLAQ